MPDPRFYARSGPFSLTEIADRVGAKVAAGAVAHLITDIASLTAAGPNDLSYVSDAALVPALAKARCGVCLVKEGMAVPSGMVALVVADPRAAFAAVAAMFYSGRTPPPAPWSAQIAASAEIDPSVVIGSGAIVGERVRIGPGSTVGAGVQIGESTSIAPNVTLSHCLIGARCIIHPGVRIGQDGFGFVPGQAGLAKMPQLGRVIIGNDVEIGANCCVDRGALEDTEIGDGTKMDNLVQIGHNVRIGRHCVIVAQVGIAGSCRIGNGVLIGGQVAVSDHITVGDGAQIAGKSGVMRDVGAGEAVMGYPALPIRQFWRSIVALSRLTKRDK